MVPPLAMALASTVLARKLFTPVERENGKAAWLLGASFICEGAIPFAAADPLRVIPASMVGGAVTGALSMAFRSAVATPRTAASSCSSRSTRSGASWSRIAAGVLVTGVPGGRLKSWVGRKELAEAEANLEVAAVPA